MKRLMKEMFSDYRKLSRESDEQQKRVDSKMEKMKQEHDKMKRENDKWFSKL